MLRSVLTESEMNRLKELAGPKVCVNCFFELLAAAAVVVFVVCCGCLHVVCLVEISFW